MKKIFPVACVLVAACLLAATPRAIHAQTGDTLHARTGTSENDEDQLRFAQRELAEAQREVMRAQLEIQRQVQREMVAEQRAVAYEAVARQREVVRAQTMAVHAQTMAIREQALARRAAAMAIQETRMEEIHKMTDQMLKDHLIEHTNDLHIELRDEHLYINGKEQPKAVYDKYRPYFHQNNQDIQLNLGQGIAI